MGCGASSPGPGVKQVGEVKPGGKTKAGQGATAFKSVQSVRVKVFRNDGGNSQTACTVLVSDVVRAMSEGGGCTSKAADSSFSTVQPHQSATVGPLLSAFLTEAMKALKLSSLPRKMYSLTDGRLLLVVLV